MASDSPRSRINQFFPSKKRKAQSPILKPARRERNALLTTEALPTDKLSLGSYLVTSHKEKISCSSVGPDAQEIIDRNFSSDVSNLREDHAKPQIAPFLNETDTAVGVHVEANSELKQFATNFLSLYCSELQSNVKLEKQRHASCSVNCINKSHDDNISKDFPLEIRESTCSEHNKSTQDIYQGEFQASLRKCSNAPSSLGRKCAVHCTPSHVDRRRHAGVTPDSGRRSSMFSPGEAFWNEAIDVADGLISKNENMVQKVEKIEDKEGGKEAESIISKISNNLVCKTSGGIDGLNSADLHTCSSASSRPQLTTIVAKTLEGSPMPVKHFDFSSEEKYSVKLSDHHYSVHDVKGLQTETHTCNEHSSGSREGFRVPVKDGVSAEPIQGDKMPSMHRDLKFERVVLTGRVDSNTSSTVDSRHFNFTATSGEHTTPSSSSTQKDHADLNHWLPPEICNMYRSKGVLKLYPWQVNCLGVEGVLQKRNLVYCASTSAGKSFVAEILMLRRVISCGKIAILVLPYVSICAEKAEHLEVLLEPLGKHVRSYYGSQGGGTLPKDTSVAVCTIEKANSLVNKLLEEGRLSEIGIVVIDELHMVGDQSRGYLLELLLTKLRYASGEGNTKSYSGESSGTSSGKIDPMHGLQVVGMSATMPNVEAVADWLEAALYETDFRPVPLEEYIKVGNTIFNNKLEVVRTLPKGSDIGGKDPDHIVELCNEVVQEGNSVLVFCSSRKGCESTAKHISQFLKEFSINILDDKSEFIDIPSVISALQKCPVGLDPILQETLPCGVAYHHAGLTGEEREIIETCYRKGLVRVLTATSTLAAGVNLPARRVVFRQPRIGRDFLDGTRYKQMAGRAGRTGIDTKGESVLICKQEEIKRVVRLVNERCEPLLSCLSEDKNGMTHAILEVVAGGIVQTANDINRYVRCTLLNSTKPFDDVVRSAQDSLRWLCHHKFIEWSEEVKLYNTTPLGRASFSSSLSPADSLIVLDDLARARESFVLASDLHLVYLVTPTNVEVEPDWEFFYEKFLGLTSLDQSVGNRVGVVEPFLMRMAHGAPMRLPNGSKERKNGLQYHAKKLVTTSSQIFSDEKALRVCRRFYVAMILSRLVQEAPVAEVCEMFKVARGMVQSLQENSGRFASMVSVFCERLGWHDLESLIAKFQNRVCFGVRAEIAELTTIPYVKGSRARALYNSGLRTLQAVAEATVTEIVKALFEKSSWERRESSQRIVQLGIAKKIRNAARRIILDKAEESRIAAFSAFKSLGLDVTELSRPVSLTGVVDSVQQEARNSSGNDSDSSFMDVKPSVPALVKERDIVNERLNRTTIGANGVHSLRGYTIGVESSAEVDSSGKDPMSKSGLVNADASNGLSCTKSFKENSDVMSGLRNGMNDSKLHSGYPADVSGILKQNIRDDFVNEYGPVNAINCPGGLDSLLELWESTGEFYFDIHFNMLSELNSQASFEIHGIAICWENSSVYYINLPRDLLWPDGKKAHGMSLSQCSDRYCIQDLMDRFEKVKGRWNRINNIMCKKNVKKVTWNLKLQIQVLSSPTVHIQRFGTLKNAMKNMGLELVDNKYYQFSPVLLQGVVDMAVVSWILWPDEERSSSPSLEKEVKKRLSSEAAAAAHRSGRWKNQMRGAAHNGCCRRVAQTRALSFTLWKLLISEALVESFSSIEIPLVSVLADMEVWGIGVDMEGCLQARHILGKKLQFLEKEIYCVAGMRFSLSSAADVAHVLYSHLKLPMPGRCIKGKRHLSTDKRCLELLRNEHPIVPLIKEHRTLAKIMNCTLGSICSLAKLSLKTQKYALRGHWLQTSTATGRISIEEPNIQCVEHLIEFKMKNYDHSGVDDKLYKINARDIFIPTQEKSLLLAADYSQIELRLMAHFSKDTSLIELFKSPDCDVFTLITAGWTGKPESSVSSQERDHTKGMVYGILYGMGSDTLAEKIGCSSDEAAERIQSFKNFFPGVASWLSETVIACNDKGYVKTISGRKRFLPNIKSDNRKEKLKARRQAVNSICQGSAADIIKIGMINIHATVTERILVPNKFSAMAEKFSMLKDRCRIVLQVHDELVLEVDSSVVKEAAELLKVAMETAVSLLVPLRVKLKVGKTWGSMEPFCIEETGQILDS